MRQQYGDDGREERWILINTIVTDLTLKPPTMQGFVIWYNIDPLIIVYSQNYLTWYKIFATSWT